MQCLLPTPLPATPHAHTARSAARCVYIQPIKPARRGEAQTGHNSRLNSQIADKNASRIDCCDATDVRRRDGSQSDLPSIYIQLRPATFSHAKLVQLPLTVSPFLPGQPDLARASTGLYGLSSYVSLLQL